MTINKENDKSSSKKRLYSRRKFLGTGLVGVAGLALNACSPSQSNSQPPQANVADPTATPPDPTTTATNLPPETATPVEVAVENPTETAPRPASVTPTDPPPATNTATHTPAPQLEPTPACDDHGETLAQTAGPFYTPNTPQRTNLIEADMVGPLLVVTGRVVTPDCQPLAGAILDFWHADAAGEYDNVGYRLRGHQFTDEQGYYRLETIMPGLYPGRTRHIHVHVQGQTTALLTTQLYFPDVPQNDQDRIFHPSLVMDVQPADDGSFQAAFDFVLAA